MSEDYRIRFLVVDDEQSIRKLCVTIGNSLGFVSAQVDSAEAALAYIDAHSPDLVLADLKLANMDGLEFLEKLKRALPRTEVAMMTGHGSIESAVQAMKRGAFTGALKPKDGLFHAANGGTLFLDEIGELPLEMQTKLLRALQEKEVRRVGSNIRTQVDVRIVAATNRDLEQAYREGTFRKDLYFRLNVVAVHLPALRERRSDILSLVHFFLDKYVPDGSLQVSNAAMKALMEYDWPGNVRELQNCIERAVALGNR